MAATLGLDPGRQNQSLRQQGKVHHGPLQPVGPVATGSAVEDEVRRAEEQLAIGYPWDSERLQIWELLGNRRPCSHKMVFWESRPFTTPTFVTFGIWAENPQFDHPRRNFPGRAPRAREGVRGQTTGDR